MGSDEDGKKCQSAGSVFPLGQGSQRLSGKLATAELRAKYNVHAALTSRTSGCREAAGWELHWPCMGSEWNSRARRSSGAGCPARGCMAAVV